VTRASLRRKAILKSLWGLEKMENVAAIPPAFVID